MKMVHTFLILTVNPQYPPKTLFSQRFQEQSCRTTSNESEVKVYAEVDREASKNALETICKRISVEYNFANSVSIRSAHDAERLHHSGSPLELHTGMFFVSKDQPPYYSADKHTIWCGALGLVFALIVESNENRGLASITLKYITKYVDDYIQAFTRHKEVLLKPHIIIHIVDKLMPCGQILFMNHKFVKHLEKELEQVITSLQILK